MTKKNILIKQLRLIYFISINLFFAQSLAKVNYIKEIFDQGLEKMLIFIGLTLLVLIVLNVMGFWGIKLIEKLLKDEEEKNLFKEL